jgi:hypothetical protein
MRQKFYFFALFLLTTFTTTAQSFNNAVDNNELFFSHGGNADWIVTTATTSDGDDAVKSGSITHSQESYFETTVTGPGTLSFNWKVSSESNYDYLRYYIDGTLQESISGITDWTQKEISIPGGSHTIRWAYTKDRSVNQHEDCGWVDRIHYSSENEYCSPPTNINFNNIDVNSATIQWETNNGADPISWQVEYGETDFTPGEGTTHISYQNNYLLSNLTPGTNYHAYLKAYCGSENESQWTGPYSFQTIDDGSDANSCSTVANYSVSQITSSSANLQWETSGNSDPISWQVEYGETDFTPGEGTTHISYMNSSFLYDLREETIYDVYIKAYCGSDRNRNWAGPFNFQTAQAQSGNISTPFNDAVNNNRLIFSHSSEANWFVTSTESVRSGNITHQQTSSFETTVIGPGILSFDWKVSSEQGWDYLQYFLDNALQERISGFVDWTRKELVIPEGQHTIKWTYYKDYMVDDLEDCGWIDNIMYLSNADQNNNCPVPKNLSVSEITANSAQIQWNADIDPISWTIEYGEGINQPPLPDDQITTTISYLKDFLLTQLEAGTDYSVRIKANCGSGEDGDWEYYTFRTESDPINLPIEEDFDNVTTPNLPSNWFQTGINNYSVNTNNWTSLSYPNASVLTASPNSEAILVSPEINQSLSSGLRINFKTYSYHSNAYYSSYFAPVIIVGTMSDPNDPETFTPVQTIDLYRNTSQREWFEITVFLSDYYGNDKHIAFKGMDMNNYYFNPQFYLDDIIIEEIPDVPEPTNLMASGIDDNSVMLTWFDNAYATSWEVVHGSPGFNPETEGTRETVFMEETILEVPNPGSEYQAFVRTGGSSQSEWSIPLIIDSSSVHMPSPANVIGSGDSDQSEDDDVATSINVPEAGNTDNSEISVYPNPVRDELFIQGEKLSPDAVIIITDLSGRTILKTTIKEQPFNLSLLPKGVYLVKIKGKITKMVKK